VKTNAEKQAYSISWKTKETDTHEGKKKKKSHAWKFEEMVGVAAGLVLRASESAELNKDLVGSL